MTIATPVSDQRLPPHSLEAEESLLGAMLHSRDALLAAVAQLTGEDFYKPAHGSIFEAAKSLHERGDAVDHVTVAAELERSGRLEGIGGPATLISLQCRTPSLRNGPTYARIIGERAGLRRLQAAATEILLGEMPSDPSAAYARALELIEGAGVRLPGPQAVDLSIFTPGGSWVLDIPPGVPAVWGSDDNVLWSEGEHLLIVGPPGVGKSSIAQQLVLAMIGCREPEVLGLPVAPADHVLYLACDRPAQIARGFARAVRPEHRVMLDDRLSVLKGPPPKDFAKHPTELLHMATAVGAGVVVVDSLKDVALGLSEDEVGSGLHTCFQHALTAGIQVLVLHHQRKGQQGGHARTLGDVYGSAWLTAGAGSVVLLWGEAGDPIVHLEHLKQPAAPVGPFEILHDHERCVSTIETGPVDPLVMLRNAPNGITVVDLARLSSEKEKPSTTDTQKARRKLDQLAAKGLARRVDASSGGVGGSTPARYYAIDNQHEEDS